MNYNPYSTELNAAKEEEISIEKNIKTLQREIDSYNNARIEEKTALLRKLEDDSLNLDKEREAFDDKLSRLMTMEKVLRSDIKSSGSWFSLGPKNLRKDLKEVKRQKKSTEDIKESTTRNIKNIEQEKNQLEQKINEHNSIDVDKLKSMIETFKLDLKNCKEKIIEFEENYNRIESIIGPVASEVTSLESEMKKTKRLIDDARNIETRLTNSESKYDRAKLHEECEIKFGTGKPGSVIRELSRKYSRIIRDLKKARDRLDNKIRVSTRKIQKIVIDGNNMCYEGGDFIGLKALTIVSRKLSCDHEILIVFDSGIRGLLKLNNEEIKRQFHESVGVHVVASKIKADETILDIGSENEETYIISNDRFGDFNDKPVVAENRIIRHEIVSGKVMIHDLNINLNFLNI